MAIVNSDVCVTVHAKSHHPFDLKILHVKSSFFIDTTGDHNYF